jgi:cytochrome c
MPFRGLCAFLVIAMLGCRREDAGPGSADAAAGFPATPAALRAGERTYEARCAGCHGSRGIGTEQGPPLVHRIYEPGHHSDAAFHLAATRGVSAHHWGFGDMPPVTDVTPGEVTAIVSYVRWLQRQAGIR